MFAGKVAKWWLPDDVLMLEELPHTATGKLNKLALRARYQDHLIEGAESRDANVIASAGEQSRGT